MKTFTLEELKQFDGTGPDGTVYVAVEGKVFDVTEKGKDFYGPGAPYSSLAGHDGSRALATMRTNDVKEEWDDLQGLSEIQKQSLIRWAQFFQDKYTQVGELRKA